MENELPKRKPTRLKNFDYSTPGAYFITMCTKNRKCILSRVGDPVRDDVKGVPQNAQIVGDDVHDVPYNVQNNVHLSHYGKIADEYIQRLNGFYGNINVDSYVIMPNHIHMILRVFDSGTPRTSSPTVQHSSVAQFVSTFKRFCNGKYGMNIWQRSYHDHIIRDIKDYERIYKYICENPIFWEKDCFYTEEI